MKQMNKVTTLLLTAIFMAIIAVTIIFIKIPIPFTQGFVNLGDGVIFLGLLILGWKYGAIAAGIGAALGDILSGYAVWAPWTLIIKIAMILVAGLIIEKSPAKNNWIIIMAMSLGGIVMMGGYYLAEGIMYGNFITPIVALPWNGGQIIVGIIMAMMTAFALSSTSLKKNFAYPVYRGKRNDMIENQQ